MKSDRHTIRLPRVIFVLFLIVFAAGCATKKEKEEKHHKRATQYIEAGELKKAVIELKNVVQLNPKNDAAYYELGETYLKLKQGQEAFQNFSRASSINPDNLEAQLKTGQILLLAKKTEEARKKAELILGKSPEDIKALMLLSGVQIQEKDIDTALKTLKKAASIDPANPKIHVSLGQLFLLKKNFDQARKEYQKAKSLDPASPSPYIILSRMYGSEGKWDQAEAELREMIKASDSDYRNRYELARFYESRKKWDQAEKSYVGAVDSAAEEDVVPLISLAGYYSRRKSFVKALEAMQKAAEIKKDDLNIRVGIAQIYLESKQIKEAGDTLDKILEKDKGHVEANFLKGRIFLLNKEFDNALPLFDLTVRERPQNAMAHYFKGLCLVGKRENRLAKENLLKAVELNPLLTDARLILAEFFLKERDMATAGQQIEAVLKQDATNIRALMLQGNLKILEQDPNGAETALRSVIEKAPDYAPGYFRLGLLYNLMGRQKDALQNLEKALKLDPKQMDALSLTVGIYTKNKNYDKANRICEKLKVESKEDPTHLAMIEYMQGNISLAEKDTDKARHHFEKAITTDANVLAAYMALARLHIKADNMEGAVSQYEALLEKNPKALAGYMGLGTIYDQQGDGKKAEANYRKALEIKSDFAPAANNLAWNLLENGKNIDEALGFAQVAKEQMPKNPSVMDTLGWIYYHKGSYLNAIGEFQDSLAREPDNPIINYHQGMAYFKNDQPDAAKESLEKALAIDRNFKGAEDARRVLREISSPSESKLE